jgi:hypothetical protein
MWGLVAVGRAFSGKIANAECTGPHPLTDLR